MFSNTFQANRLKINLFWKNSGVRQPLIWFKSRKKNFFQEKTLQKMFRRFSIRLLYSTWKPLIGFSMWRGKKIKNWKHTHSLYLTHTHTQTLPLSLSHAQTQTHAPSLFCTYTHSLTFTHFYLPLSLKHTHIQTKVFPPYLNKVSLNFHSLTSIGLFFHSLRILKSIFLRIDNFMKRFHKWQNN